MNNIKKDMKRIFDLNCNTREDYIQYEDGTQTELVVIQTDKFLDELETYINKVREEAYDRGYYDCEKVNTTMENARSIPHQPNYITMTKDLGEYLQSIKEKP